MVEKSHNLQHQIFKTKFELKKQQIKDRKKNIPGKLCVLAKNIGYYFYYNLWSYYFNKSAYNIYKTAEVLNNLYKK